MHRHRDHVPTRVQRLRNERKGCVSLPRRHTAGGQLAESAGTDRRNPSRARATWRADKAAHPEGAKTRYCTALRLA
jgi:hypothetical protein